MAIMKVSNETKVGVLTAISITLLILGFNFLKGKNPLKSSHYLYALFESIEGLQVANPVLMSGLTIGSVYKTEPADRQMNAVLVTIRINEKVLIPKDSRAVIKGNLLSTPVIEITKGSSAVYLAKGDTMLTEESSGFMGSVLEQLGPTQQSLNVALQQLDTMLVGVNRILTSDAQADLRVTIRHLSTITANLAEGTSQLKAILQSQNQAVRTSISNLETTTRQLREGTQNLPAISKNIEEASRKLNEADLGKTLESLDATLVQTRDMLAKMSSDEGTLGALMNDKRLYNNMASTVNSLNLLMQDLRLHPKRYVNVSVFGRRDRVEPLMRPMDEDSITQEQFRHKKP